MQFKTILYFCLLGISLSANSQTANSQSQKANPQEIEIVRAVFGQGKNAARCESRIRGIIQDKKVITTITSKGLRLKNRRGGFRHQLVIIYKIDGVEHKLVLKNSQKVNIYQELIANAKKSTDQQTPKTAEKKPKPLEKPTDKPKPDAAKRQPDVNKKPMPGEANAKPPEVAANETSDDEQKNASIVNLDGKCDSFCAGGDGRFLIFHLNDKNVLVVFDVVKQKLIKELPAQAESVFAASQNKLIILNTEKRLLERYDLITFRKEKSVEWPVDKDLPTVARMGSHGSGPLLLWADKEVELWDIESLKPMAKRGTRLNLDKDRDARFSVSADGNTFCGWLNGISGQVFYAMNVYPNSTHVIQTPDTHSMNERWIMPSAHGEFFTRFDSTKYNAQLESADEIEQQKTKSYFPTHDARFVVAIEKNRDRNKRELDCRLFICSATDLKPLCDMDSEFELCSNSIGTLWGRLNMEPRVRYYHDQKKLLLIPNGNDQIVILDLDLPAIVKQENPDYLRVISMPPAEVTVNETFEYDIKALSSAKRISFGLQESPPGMKISKHGLITWRVDQRPASGRVKTAVEISDSNNQKTLHSFEIQVLRDLTQPNNKKAKNGFVEIDDLRMELPEKIISVTPGSNGRSLLLSENYLATTDTDGWSIKNVIPVNRKYKKILERQKYYVAIADNPSEFCVLRKSDLKVLRSMKIGVRNLIDIVLHPTKPISYVTGSFRAALPGYQFLVIDEKKATGLENPNWIGNWLAVSADGSSMYAGYSDIYRNGSELIMNPTRWHVSPKYGDLSWLLKYELGRNGTPKLVKIKEGVGANGKGIRLSNDGKRITYLSHVGYPKYSKNLAGWNTDNFSQIPVSYPTKDIATTYQLEFHPVLPLATSPGKDGPAVFDRESGAILKDRLTVELSEIQGLDEPRLYFSQDGLNLIVEGGIRGIRYLHKVPLRLNRTEKSSVAAGIKAKAKTAAKVSLERKAVSLPLAKIDSFSGGKPSEMKPVEIARAFKKSVVVVQSSDATGTGFVVGSKGLILTCAHCVPSDSVQIAFDNKNEKRIFRDAEIIVADEKLDLALLQLKQPIKLTPVVFSFAEVETGETVSIIGNPVAGNSILDQTMTLGIVSNPSREIEDVNFIQTSAAVNPGCSGGPMFDSCGQVIGMVALKANIEAAGFALPTNEISRFLMKNLYRKGDARSVGRDWYSKDGRGPLKARILKLETPHVILERTSDRKEFKMKLTELSLPDQKFVNLWLNSK